MNHAYLSEAFQNLGILNEEDFTLTSGENGIEDMKDFLDHDEKVDFVDIIDPEAETEEEIEDTYMGKVILDCCVCHSKIYKGANEVTVNEDGECANEGEECPYCYSVDGFKIVGQVAPYQPESELKVEVEDKPEETETEIKVDADEDGTPEVEVKTEKEPEEEKVEESLKEDAKWEIAQDFDDEWHQAFDEYYSNCFVVDSDGENEEEFDTFEEAVAYAKSLGLDTVKVYPFAYEDEDGEIHEFYGAMLDLDGEIADYLDESYCAKCGKDVKEPCEKCKEKMEDEEKKIDEGFEKVELETEDKVIKVSEEPKEAIPDAEMVAPISPEVKDEINVEEPEEEEVPPMEAPTDVDVDIDDFDEESFNDLGESYLKKVYENVNSFKTSSVKSSGNKLTLEGVIKFASGKEKSTTFMFEAKDITSSGLMRFVGENAQISRGKKSFTLTGRMNNNQFINESLNYNYRAKTPEGKSTRLYGTVKTSKK